MSDSGQRTGAARDVPPPRPVFPPPPAPEESGPARAGRAVADAVAGLVGGRPSTAGTLRDVVGAIAGAVDAALGRDEQRSDGESRPWSPGAVLGDLLSAAAPRLPIRDAARLRMAHPGLSDDEIADALVARAARLTSGIGAATGGLAAASWFAPPSLLALPLEMGAETVLVGGVEVVLLGELHELYGRRPAGDGRERAGAYVAAWSAQRAVDGATAGVGSLLGAAGVRALRRQVTRRMARGIPVAAPFLIGAALAGRGNRRATEALARTVLADLRAPRPLDTSGGSRG